MSVEKKYHIYSVSTEQPVVYKSKASSLNREIYQKRNDLKKAVKKRNHAKIKQLKISIREKEKQAKHFDKLFKKKCKNGDFKCDCHYVTSRDLIKFVETTRFEYSKKCPFDHGEYMTDKDQRPNTFEKLVSNSPVPQEKPKSYVTIPLEDFSSEHVVSTIGHHEDR